jgi:hypothetical protein
MEQKMYILFENSGQVIGQSYFEEGQQPENSTDVLPTQTFIEMYFDKEKKEYYEKAPQEAVELKARQEIPETPLWRIRAVLRFMEQEENIANAISHLPEPTKTGAEYIWNYGTVIERNSQTVLFLQSVLQMTDLQVDEIFIQANNIQI